MGTRPVIHPVARLVTHSVTHLVTHPAERRVAYRARRWSIAIAAMCLAGWAHGQVVVSSGETLTEANLTSGSFAGAAGSFAFSLGSETTFNIDSGGSIGPVGDGVPFPGVPFDFQGSTVNLDGGAFVSDSAVDSIVSNVTVNVLPGGTLGRSFEALSGSVINVAGGEVVLGFAAFSGATINISGGTVGDFFTAQSGSTVNLFVNDAAVGGVELGLSLGDAVEIAQRGGALLEATLADGSSFELVLDPSDPNGDIVASDAMLTVTLVPTPGAAGVLGLACLAALWGRRASTAPDRGV